MKYFTRNIIESELIRHTTVLISGTVIAQSISVMLQPLLRRMFTAEAFGTFSVYLSIVAILAVITPLRYDDAIVLPKKDSDSANVLFLSLIFNSTLCLALFLLIILFGEEIFVALNIPPVLPVTLLYLIPLSIFLLNTYQSFNYWLIRKKQYYAVTSNKIARRSTEGISQVTFAILRYPRGLIYSDIIGQLANNAVTIVKAFRSDFKISLLNKDTLKAVMHEYSDFPKFNLIPALMSACSFYVPVLFINKFYTLELTGYFDLSKLLLSIPLAFVASSISNVLLQRLTEKYRKNESFIEDLKPSFYIVLLIAAVELAAILLFSNEIFNIAFGKTWTVSAEISTIMVWSFTLNFLVSSFTCIFISMKKIKIYSIWQLIYFASIVSLILFKDLGFKDFIKVYVLVEVICYLLLIVLLAGIVGRYESSLRKAVIK